MTSAHRHFALGGLWLLFAALSQVFLYDLSRVEPAVRRELAETGEVPGRQVGGDWRFAREALLTWLAS